MRRPLSALSLSCLMLIGASLEASTSSASASQSSAAKLLAAALSAANGSGSMLFVDKTTSGKSVQQLQGAISAPTASETLTGQGAPLQVELIASNIYVRGDAIALESALEISATQATPAADKWVLITTADAPFQLLAQTLTITSTLAEFTPQSNSALRAQKVRKVDGKKVIPLVGAPTGLSKGTSGSAALFVSPKAPHLPLGGSLVLASKSGRLNEVAVFSHWGAKVSLTAPTGALPFNTVLSY